MKIPPTLLIALTAMLPVCVAGAEESPEAAFWNLHVDAAVMSASARDTAFYVKVLTDGGGARGVIAYEMFTRHSSYDIHDSAALNEEVVAFVVSTPDGSTTRKLPLHVLWSIVQFCDDNEFFEMSETRAKRSFDSWMTLDSGLVLVFLKTPKGSRLIRRGADHVAFSVLLEALGRVNAGKDPFTVYANEPKRKEGEPSATDNPGNAQ